MTVVFDLHTHHHRCGHALGEIEDYIQAAIEKGMDYIGIADHSPYFYSDEDQLYPGIAMGKSELANYVEEVLALKKKYKQQIHVLLGMESDFFQTTKICTNVCMRNTLLITLLAPSIM